MWKRLRKSWESCIIPGKAYTQQLDCEKASFSPVMAYLSKWLSGRLLSSVLSWSCSKTVYVHFPHEQLGFMTSSCKKRSGLDICHPTEHQHWLDLIWMPSLMSPSLHPTRFICVPRLDGTTLWKTSDQGYMRSSAPMLRPASKLSESVCNKDTTTLGAPRAHSFRLSLHSQISVLNVNTLMS